MKTMNTENPKSNGCSNEILNANKAIVSEVTSPELIQARIYAPVNKIERLTVEWWSVDDGLLSVQQPDSLGRIQFNTIQTLPGYQHLRQSQRRGSHYSAREVAGRHESSRASPC